LIQFHLCIHNFSKETFPVLCTDRDEIGAGLDVTVTRQPDGSAVVFLTIETQPLPRDPNQVINNDFRDHRAIQNNIQVGAVHEPPLLAFMRRDR
jgi:hypothetical protein